MIQLNETWLAGKHEISTGIAEINTAIGYVSIPGFFPDSEDTNFFAQGDEADEVIKEIHQIWLNGDCSVNDAIEQYMNIYGY